MKNEEEFSLSMQSRLSMTNNEKQFLLVREIKSDIKITRPKRETAIFQLIIYIRDNALIR